MRRYLLAKATVDGLRRGMLELYVWDVKLTGGAENTDVVGQDGAKWLIAVPDELARELNLEEQLEITIAVPDRKLGPEEGRDVDPGDG